MANLRNSNIVEKYTFKGRSLFIDVFSFIFPFHIFILLPHPANDIIKGFGTMISSQMDKKPTTFVVKLFNMKKSRHNYSKIKDIWRDQESRYRV